jgi:hypothetical protein
MDGGRLYSTSIGGKMKAIEKIIELIDYVNPLLDPEKITDETEAEMKRLRESIADELERAVVVKPEHSVQMVKTFEDFSKRAEDTVELEISDGVIKSIPIQSITQAEASHIRRVLLEGRPVEPKRRKKDGVPDENDTVYDKEIVEHDIKLAEFNNKILFEYLKVGMKIDIPGDTDEDKFANCEGLMAGAVNKIAQSIMSISCLNEERVSLF